MKKRVIALLLTLALLLGSVPVGVSAAPVKEDKVTTAPTVTGSNGVGNLLAETINAQQQMQTNANYPYGYGVSDLTFAGNVATVRYAAAKDAVVIVAVYSEDGRQLRTSATAPVSADGRTVEVTFGGDLPAYFRASAFLLEPDGYTPLCASYSTPMYTKAMRDLMASTVDDYNPEKVWNFDGDKTNNFFVFDEDTIVIRETGNPTVTENGLVYTVKNGSETLKTLKPGDKFAYLYGEDGVIVAEVAGITVDGDTVTVTGGDIDLYDIFSHIKMDAGTTTEGFEVTPDPTEKRVTYIGEEAPAVYSRARTTGEGDSDQQKIKKLWFEIGKPDEEEDDDDSGSDDGGIDAEDTAEVTVEGKIGIGAVCDFSYFLADETEYMQFRVDAELDIQVSISGKLGTTYKLGKLSSPPICGILTISFAVEYTVEFSAAIEFNNTIHFIFGFTIDDQNGCQSLNEPPMTVKGTVALKGEFKMYFTWNPSLELAKGFIASLSLPLETGVVIAGAENGTFLNGMPGEDEGLESIHLCERCTRVTFGFVFNMKVEIEFLNCKWLKVALDVFTEDDFDNGLTVLECYYSEDLGHGGFGPCPNQKHRVTIQAQYKNEIPIRDLNMWYRYVDDSKIFTIPGKTNIYGIISCYMERGNYTFFTTIHDIRSEAKVEVTEPSKVIIRESETGQIQATVLGKSQEGLVMDAGLVKEYGVCGVESPDYPTGNNLTWALYDTGVLKIYGTGEMGSAPWRNSRIKVTAVIIDEGATNLVREAFYRNTTLTKAVLPDSLERIEYMAFGSCTSLTEVNMPANLKELESYAFYNCDKIARFTLPEGLTTIDDYAFGACGSLEIIRIPDSVTHLGSCALTGCSALTHVVLPRNLTAISDSLFSGCGALVGVSIPSSVTSIGSGAFSSCKSITEITIPNGVTELGDSLFHSCTALTQVNLPAGLTTIGNSAFRNCESLRTLPIPTAVREIGEHAFAGCKNLQTITIPAGVTTINAYTFSGCENLQTISLPATLTAIAGYGFSGCTGPSIIRLPASVTSIGGGAFNNCTNLVEMEIPSGVAAIGDYTFQNCHSLQRVTLPQSVNSLGYAAFYNCKALTSVNIPTGVTELAGHLFDGCTALQNITLPTRLTKIGKAAFQSCKSLLSFTIPATVTTISEYAFHGCESLTTMVIPKGITELENNIFSGAVSLSSVLLPEGITTIGDSAFWGCESLEEVALPSTVRTIESQAFCKCKALRSMVIPEGVTELGYEIFYECYNLSSIRLPSTLKSIGTQTFYDCDSLTHVDIPEGVTSLSNSFSFCSSLQTVSLPSTLETLSGTFRYCDALVEITIPDSVTAIGGGTFYYCENLSYVDMGNSIQTIGTSAFHGCKNLGAVVFSPTLTRIYSSAFQECETLSLLVFQGGAPTIDTWAFLCTFRGEYITAYYPAGNPTWASANLPTYNGKITWVAGSAARTQRTPVAAQAGITIAPAPESDHQQVTAIVPAPQLRAIIGGQYGTEEQDGTTLKTAAFTDLVPGEAYVLLAVKGLQKDTFLSPDNILYITQAVAGADGKLSFRYIQREATPLSYVMVCGKSNKDIKDATVIFPPMLKDTELQAVNPTVTWGGSKLTEGVDYTLSGQVCYEKPGTYTLTIRGINQYTGAVECTYTVSDAVPGDFTGDGFVTEDDVIHLLWHTVDPDTFTLNQQGDYTGDGFITEEDVIHLLWHTVDPDTFPLQ